MPAQGLPVMGARPGEMEILVVLLIFSSCLARGRSCGCSCNTALILAWVRGDVTPCTDSSLKPPMLCLAVALSGNRQHVGRWRPHPPAVWYLQATSVLCLISLSAKVDGWPVACFVKSTWEFLQEAVCKMFGTP